MATRVGFASSGFEFGVTNNSQSTYNYFGNKGFETVRLPFKWDDLQPQLNGNLDPTFLTLLDTQVTEALNAGLKVILDMHNFGRRDIFPAGGFTSDFASSDSLWKPEFGNISDMIVAGRLNILQWYHVFTLNADNPVSPKTSYKVTVDARIDANQGTDIWRGLDLEFFKTSDNNRYYVHISNLANAWEVHKVVNGTDTILASGSRTFTLGIDQTFVFDVGQTTPGLLLVSINGSQVASVALDAALTGGRVSFFASGVTASVDNFTLNVAGDTTSGRTNAGTYRIGDSLLTTDHFADFWRKMASHYLGNSTILGYDLMNEFHDMPVPTTTATYNTTATVTLANQAAINAIRGIDATPFIYAELDSWAGAQSFVSGYGTNPTPWLSDPANKLVYSFHYYMDDDHSGSYSSGFKQSNYDAISPDVSPILIWGQNHGLKTHCGEYGVPDASDSWNSCITNLLTLCQQYNADSSYWAAGDAYTSTTTLQPTNSFATDRHQMLAIAPFFKTPTTGKLASLLYRAIDTMKNNKDNVTGQASDIFIQNIIAVLANNFNITHLAISIPLETTASFTAAGVTMPGPRTIEDYYDKWTREIHARGLSVWHRGTLCGIEQDGSNQTGLYGFPWLVGGNRYPAGDAGSVLGNIFSDNFNRAQLGPAWAPVGTFFLANNELVGGAPTGGWGNLCLTQTVYSDFTVTAKLKYNNQNTQLAFRTSTSQGYSLQLRTDGGGQIRFERWGVANLGATNTPLTAGTYYNVKVVCTGSILQAKVWAVGTAEPATFTLSITDTTYTVGQIGFSSESDSQVYDDIVITPVTNHNNLLGKIYDFIVNHPSFFQNGDIWAPLPERTQGIFNDATAFLPNTGAGLQTNYAQFFIDLHAVSLAAFTAIGKPGVICGLTANNYSEVSSGWIPQSLFTDALFDVFDHYGVTHTATELDNDYSQVYVLHGLNLIHSEWGDYWNSGMTPSDRAVYLQSIYNVMGKYIAQGKLVGFNYWGGWSAGTGEQILSQLGPNDNPTFSLAQNGTILQANFASLTPAQTTTSTSSSTSTTSTSSSTSTTSTSSSTTRTTTSTTTLAGTSTSTSTTSTSSSSSTTTSTTLAPTSTSTSTTTVDPYLLISAGNL